MFTLYNFCIMSQGKEDASILASFTHIKNLKDNNDILKSVHTGKYNRISII